MIKNPSSVALSTLIFAYAFASVKPAEAAYTTVDISSVLNSNIAINPSTFPVGLTNGNTGTGIPFLTSPLGSAGNMGTWIAPGWQTFSATGSSISIDVTAQNISGQASFYALLNNYFGTPGENEYNITITATDGDFVTYSALGGVNTRDYNENIFTNDIADTTTEWFNNGIGQRLDVRVFTLPAEFATKQIESFDITQVHNRDAAVFSGITFSDEPPVLGVPESGSAFAMFGLVIGGMTVLRRKLGIA